MGRDARGALRHRVSGDDSAAGDRFWAAARHVVVGPAVANDAARDLHHVQRDGHAIYQPYRTHRPLRLLLYPGRDAAISALGVFFPVDHFPAPVPQVAWFTPLYHAVNVCRELATGPSVGVLVDLAWILVFTGVLALIPVQIMRRRLIG